MFAIVLSDCHPARQNLFVQVQREDGKVVHRGIKPVDKSLLKLVDYKS